MPPTLVCWVECTDIYKNILIKYNKNKSGSAVAAWFVKASVFHSVNLALSTNGGWNPIEVWCINHSVVERLCRNSQCRVPGPSKIGFIIHAFNVSC